jgi:hypothetical protein
VSPLPASEPAFEAPTAAPAVAARKSDGMLWAAAVLLALAMLVYVYCIRS